MLILFVLLSVCSAQPTIDNNSPSFDDHPIILDPNFVDGASTLIQDTAIHVYDNVFGQQLTVEKEQDIFLHDANDTKLNWTINITM